MARVAALNNAPDTNFRSSLVIGLTTVQFSSSEISVTYDVAALIGSMGVTFPGIALAFYVMIRRVSSRTD
jgi:hypothetical protein